MRKQYDVIVVGTGAGGSTAIKALCEAGLNVVALNSGRPINPAKDFSGHIRDFELPFRGLGDPKVSKSWVTCETERTTDKNIWEHDIGYTKAEDTEWVWSRCKAVGGKANFWGRSSARFSEMDFRAAREDGADIEWPISYQEIAPYYDRVERYIGVASTVQNRPSNPDGIYLRPIPFRAHDQILQKSAKEIGVPYLPDRVAQLTQSHNDHPPCHYCGRCGSGCDTGSFFSPSWFTLPDAELTGNLELRTNAHVREVLVGKDERFARGVAYVDRDTGEEIEVEGKAIILAASCCETAKIMLNSTSSQWPNGIANSSGQVGRNISDHLYGISVNGFLPQLIGKESRPDNVHDSTVAWMPRWQNLNGRDHDEFIRGYSMYPYGGCDSFPWWSDYIGGFGSSFKKNIRRFYGAPVNFLIQAPSLPSTSNYMDIDPDKKDLFGIPLARFHFSWGENELAMWEHSKLICSEIVENAGGEIWEVGGEPSPPGSSLHETGTCRFGYDPETSVTNSFSQTHDVLNLFVCDASIFPFATDKTSTLGIMAFSLRTADHIHSRFKDGSIA
ncbi:MAG: hypothetical protein CMO98_00945 [Woeseia sp.]|nr:hypothetical protein [Woeseia sp.]